MEQYIFDKNNGLWYELQGDYYIPCLAVPAEEETPIGLWGQRHLRFIKQERKVSNHHFKWWFANSPIRAEYMGRLKAVLQAILAYAA